ncbi:hypothetical protein BLNAU_12308 [Blattamonas nauphoetae]|uniref:Uncharacterized protein n=1 Tax=Blattamonas nauphoetae TaxID=2049346 RepID=A0ABQ9XPD1_9EUKA|nr:hypothetical protein BLNAU_12308 [Blattamonas nauphoetae]
MSLVGGLDALCTGLSDFISSEKEKKVKANQPVSEQPEGVLEKDESEFSLLSRSSSAVSLIEATLGEMWTELQRHRQSSEFDQQRKALRKEVAGVLMEHFPHSFTPRREKPEGVIGLDIGKERQKVEEQLQMKMREMEAEMQILKDQLKRTEITQRWVELEQERQSKFGASAIELFDRSKWTVAGNVVTTQLSTWSSLASFEFGAVVARLSLTIRKGSNSNFVVGIISSYLSKFLSTNSFPLLKGGAGWNLNPTCLYAMQNKKDTNRGSACLEGIEGQKVVLEADGREGKRTLKLSQDGETQPVFFTNIPVPFRFAVFIWKQDDSVEIESIKVVSEPQMVGGTNPVEMDE